jgi:acetyltransferase-like isoleucine patch superfamily enzyme
MATVSYTTPWDAILSMQRPTSELPSQPLSKGIEAHAYLPHSGNSNAWPAALDPPILGRHQTMNTSDILRRFLMPAPVVSLVYLAKHGCKISFRAEVELTPNLSIGRGTQVSSFVKIKASHGPLRIGERVMIATGVFMDAHAGGLEIGDLTMVGPNCVLVAVNYRYDRLDVPLQDQEKTSKGIRIGKDVWLGANVVVMDGAMIGDHTIVGPGSVVSGSLPDKVVASGSPAKVVFKRR